MLAFTCHKIELVRCLQKYACELPTFIEEAITKKYLGSYADEAK